MFYRQIHPSWIKDDAISSQAFKPTPKDENKLSVYDGKQFSAKDSFDHFTDKGLQSAGVLGVTNDEFNSENLNCLPDDSAFKGHVLVDYSSCTSKGQIEKKAKKIRDIAQERSWMYQPQPKEESI